MKKINYLKKCGWLLGCAFAMTAFSACSDDSNDNGPATPDITPGTGFTENITLLPEPGAQAIQFTAGTNWTAQSNQTWLKLNGKASTTGTAGEVQINMTYEENTDLTDRPATITLTAGSTTKTINVSQKAAGRVIAFKTATNDTLKLAKDMKAFNAEIIANVEWEYVADSLSADDSQWIGVTIKDGKVAIAISNQDGLNRCARLVFRDKNFTSFTKALFVHVQGWGEEFVEWDLSQASFDTTGGKATISATYVSEVAPRALISDANGNIADSTADWITFADQPAPQSVLQDKVWEMTVEKNNSMDARYAVVFVVPTSMTNAQVIEQQNSLAKETVVQSGETAPRLEFTLFYFNAAGTWTNAGVLFEFLFENAMMETSATLSVNTNCDISAPRVVILDAQGNEKEPIFAGLGANQFITRCELRAGTNNIDLTLLAGSAAMMNRADNWVAVDLMNGTTKLRTEYFKATMKSVMEQP